MNWQTLDTPLPLADMRSNATRTFSQKPFTCFLDLEEGLGRGKRKVPLARPGVQVEFDDGKRLLIGDALPEGDEPYASDDCGLRMDWSRVGYKKVVRWRDLLAEPAV